MWNIIKKKKTIYRNRLTDIKTKLGYQRQMWLGRDKSVVWHEHIYTIIYKINNQQAPTVQQRELV